MEMYVSMGWKWGWKGGRLTVEERCSGDSQHTSEEISRSAVTTGCGGGVGAVGANHVIDRCHVDSVVCDTDNGGEDHGSYPVNWRAGGCPSEADQADWEAGCCVEKPPETGLVLCSFVVRLSLAFSDVTFDSWEERDPTDEVTDADGDECKTDLNGAETPLLVDNREGLNEHEDERIGETREKGQGHNDWFSEEHLEWSNPGDQDLLGGEAVPEWNKLIGTPDVLVFARLPSLLGNVVHHDGAPGFGHVDEV